MLIYKKNELRKLMRQNEKKHINKINGHTTSIQGIIKSFTIKINLIILTHSKLIQKKFNKLTRK